MVERRLGEIVAGQAAAYEVRARLDYQRSCPATVNDPQKTAFAANVAFEIAGEANVDAAAGPEMGGKDFACMLAARPGAHLFVGQGKGAGLHHPGYDFNDAVAPAGGSFLRGSQSGLSRFDNHRHRAVRLSGRVRSWRGFRPVQSMRVLEPGAGAPGVRFSESSRSLVHNMSLASELVEKNQ